MPDDRAAMREFRRILRPSGWAILDSPVDSRRRDTYEDPRIVDPSERERAFGQFDHVRVYGQDYEDRLRSAGFSADTVPCASDTAENLMARYGLARNTVLLCRPS